MICNARVHFGAGLGVLALLFATAAWVFAGMGVVAQVVSVGFAWCSLNAGFVAVGYACNMPSVFGKRVDGGRAPWARVFLLPYFGVVAIARWLQRTVTGEDAFNQVTPMLYVGRLVETSELPDDVTLVADLTAELDEPRRTRDQYAYVCLPTLDGMAPKHEALRTFVDQLVAHQGVLYVHCAAGHGRAAMAAATVLVRRGEASGVHDAQRLLRTKRPKVRMTRIQREAVTAAGLAR